MARPEAEKVSGMSLTEQGGGSEEWAAMNHENREAMREWKRSPDKRVNKGKEHVGVPMTEVLFEMPQVQYVD